MGKYMNVQNVSSLYTSFDPVIINLKGVLTTTTHLGHQCHMPVIYESSETPFFHNSPSFIFTNSRHRKRAIFSYVLTHIVAMPTRVLILSQALLRSRGSGSCQCGQARLQPLRRDLRDQKAAGLLTQGTSTQTFCRFRGVESTSEARDTERLVTLPASTTATFVARHPTSVSDRLDECSWDEGREQKRCVRARNRKM